MARFRSYYAQEVLQGRRHLDIGIPVLWFDIVEMKPLLIDQVLTAVMTMMNAESMPVELA
ncbi:hypothetical protein DERF_004218, partial [Dermatophagoides farinae]